MLTLSIQTAYNLDHQLFEFNLDSFNICHRFITKILEWTRFIVDNPSSKLMQFQAYMNHATTNYYYFVMEFFGLSYLWVVA